MKLLLISIILMHCSNSTNIDQQKELKTQNPLDNFIPLTIGNKWVYIHTTTYWYACNSGFIYDSLSNSNLGYLSKTNITRDSLIAIISDSLIINQNPAYISDIKIFSVSSWTYRVLGIYDSKNSTQTYDYIVRKKDTNYVRDTCFVLSSEVKCSANSSTKLFYNDNAQTKNDTVITYKNNLLILKKDITNYDYGSLYLEDFGLIYLKGAFIRRCESGSESWRLTHFNEELIDTVFLNTLVPNGR